MATFQCMWVTLAADGRSASRYELRFPSHHLYVLKIRGSVEDLG